MVSGPWTISLSNSIQEPLVWLVTYRTWLLYVYTTEWKDIINLTYRLVKINWPFCELQLGLESYLLEVDGGTRKDYWFTTCFEKSLHLIIIWCECVYRTLATSWSSNCMGRSSTRSQRCMMGKWRYWRYQADLRHPRPSHPTQSSSGHCNPHPRHCDYANR